MNTKDLRSIATKVGTTVGLGVALFAAGCGSNAPCNTDPAQVEAARAELHAAQQEVESGSAALTKAQQDMAKLEQDIAALPDTGELESELETLKKGSGR